MPRLVQTVLFFALLGAGLFVMAPYSTDSELFGVLLSWSIVSATVVYVLPWVYFDLRTVRGRKKS